MFVHNSVDGDNPAAMRYTEARMDRKAEELLADIDKDTVDFVPNFDGSLKEPTVLPAKLPNLLINGSSGIAVGMATNIPPHNVGEIIDGAVMLIDDPEAAVSDLMNVVHGPDFPTGGTIVGVAGIKSAYATGRGKVITRSKTEIEEHKNRERIIVSEIPYMVNKSHLIEQIAILVKDKVVQGISDIRDESDRDGMRIVIELKKDAASDIVLNQLLKHTRMRTTFGIIMLTLVDNEPKVLNLKQTIQYYVDHRKEIVTRRTKFELDKAEKRMHIVEGLIIALNDIDNVVQKIKKSKDIPTATNMLMTDYKLSEEQAKAILDMKLQKLSSLEQQKLRDEHGELKKLIVELKGILADETKIFAIIKKELLEAREKYADDRRTQIEEGEDDDIEIEDMIEEHEVVVTISHQGYIKRLPVDTYRAQNRGGKGVIGATSRDEDFTEDLFVSSTHSYILFFSNKGKVYWLKVFNIPEASRQAKGKAIVNLIGLDKDERITAFIPVKEFGDNHFLSLVTKKGTIKKTDLKAYSRPRQGGIIAINLVGDDELVRALMTNGSQQIMIASKNGMAVKFNESDARAMGRTSMGVRGIKLKGDDEVVDALIANDEKTVLTVTENGYGKRTKISDYRLINRGGSGVINIQCSARNGKVVEVKAVEDDDDMILVSKNGIIIRMASSGISVIGRNTQGVRLMKLKEDDRVMSAAKIVSNEEKEIDKE
ncbi:DNA gyrase subunit A [Nanoarchaeota archaeon]